MKKITLLFFVLFAFVIYSCDKDNDIDSFESNEVLALNEKPVDLPFTGPKPFQSITEEEVEFIIDEEDYCGEPIECTLIAGQSIDAGLVTVMNDDEYLYVKVYSKAGFQAVEENIKMWIGLTPPDRRPPSGDFPYKTTENGDTHIFKILLTSLPEWDNCGSSYVIIVHGDVLTEEGNSESGETAYGGCDGVDGQPWWAYMDYTTQCCEEEVETSLGWLYKINYLNRVKCFETMFNEEVAYGFSNRYNYMKEDYEEGVSYPVYSNVMEDCDTSQISMIGSVTIYILGFETDQARVKLVFEANEGVEISYWQGYVGWINPILENGKFDPVLNPNTFGLDVIDGVGEREILVSDWAGTMGDGGLDGEGIRSQYYIISRFTQVLN